MKKTNDFNIEIDIWSVINMLFNISYNRYVEIYFKKK